MMKRFIRKISRYRIHILVMLVIACILACLIWLGRMDFAMMIILIILVAILAYLVIRYVKLIKKGPTFSNNSVREEKAKLILGMVIVIVLICILPLGKMVNSILGLVLDNRSRAYNLTAEQMSKQDKDIYNSMIKNYIGDRKNGSEVKAMIDNIIVQNDQFAGIRGKFISVKVKGNIPNYYRPEVLKIICDAANTFSGGNNTQENVDAAKEQMKLLYKVLTDGKIYEVEPEEKDGIIHTVYIKLAK